MRIRFGSEELAALAQACGEVTAGEMETWEPGALAALNRAWDKIISARQREDPFLPPGVVHYGGSFREPEEQAVAP